jgi:hypothetical protein
LGDLRRRRRRRRVATMSMSYEEMVAIGGNINSAIQQTLREYQIDNPDLLGALAQAILIQLDQAGYKIVRK